MGSTHVVEKLSFSLFLSFLTFDFDSILGYFFTFSGPNKLFLRLGLGSKTFLGSTHVVEKLSFSMFSSISIFDFYLILGSFLFFGALTGFFGVGEGSKHCFRVYSCS